MISLIVVTYNSAHLLPAFATALATDTLAPAYELIIVDNASHDAPWQVLPDATWVQLPSNVGFGTACNRGVVHATGDYFVFLNPDVLVTPGWLTHLHAHLVTHPDVALIAPETLYPDEQRILRPGIADRPTLPGAALMVSRSHWESLGGFDEMIFLYWEDTDLCWRAQFRGYRTVAACDTAVVHQRGGSGGGTHAWLHEYTKNGLYVHLKLQPWWRVGWFVMRQYLVWPLHVARGASPHLWQALHWNWQYRHVTFRLRHQWRPNPKKTLPH